MNKHDLRIVKTKKNVHQSLLQLLRDKPLSHIKITELCKCAQINRGTFYFHYEDINDVLEELFEEIMQDLEASYREPFAQGFDLDVRNLNAETIQIFHHIEKYKDFYMVVLAEDAPMKYYYMLHKVVCDLHTDQRFSKETMNPFAQSFSANAVLGLVIAWQRNGFRETVSEMNELLVNIVQIKY